MPLPDKALDSPEIIRVSISEAARLFGVNAQTIRRAIKNQEVTYVVVAGRYKINFSSLVAWSQSRMTIKHKSATRGIGQFVDRWKIRNTLYSPSAKSVKPPRRSVGVSRSDIGAKPIDGSEPPVTPPVSNTETAPPTPAA